MVNGNGQSDIPIYCNHHGRKNKKGKSKKAILKGKKVKE